MGTLLSKMPPQTLYVTVPREDLRRLREERDQLQRQVAQLTQQLQQPQVSDKLAPA